MSYDRNLFPYRGLIGARGIGKSYSMQNMIARFYQRVRHMLDDPNNVDDLFIWSRLTMNALKNMAENVLDSKIQRKYNIKAEMVSRGSYYEFYFNDRLMGLGLALQNAPIYKGGVWQWQRFKYYLLDEFQREKKERRTFDIVYNLRSILESVTRFTTRLEEGYDLPYVIFMGNTVDEATDLLFMFDFMPMKFGMYKLPKSHAIIEFASNSARYDAIQKKNPLKVLSKGDDFTFGERKLKVRDKIIDWRNTGERKYLGHIQMTDYITFEVWSFHKGIYVSHGLKTAKFENKKFTLHRLAGNKGTYYSVDFHKIIRKYYENNQIYFDKRITASIFNNNVV